MRKGGRYITLGTEREKWYALYVPSSSRQGVSWRPVPQGYEPEQALDLVRGKVEFPHPLCLSWEGQRNPPDFLAVPSGIALCLASEKFLECYTMAGLRGLTFTQAKVYDKGGSRIWSYWILRFPNEFSSYCFEELRRWRGEESFATFARLNVQDADASVSDAYIGPRDLNVRILSDRFVELLVSCKLRNWEATPLESFSLGGRIGSYRLCDDARITSEEMPSRT
jgi:hypothetical protein